ncbi:SulP family inorganic anion transporter [Parvularcula dongshanensis]|uniref:MFS superfamily sulfate permease-like transporter n=1 Tax=Parvularcula dongshanensis TaxID=1173995 RepID=A0A840I4K1_9PROT|nr:SulP family inorganic anion transporter [Parvularcula dongshanensis]MBB4659098.1 MFS superfamily sulfate permease-like transporter [Parvularcula dongshanensis]
MLQISKPTQRLGLPVAYDRKSLVKDVAASFVVFLVAIPLCLGIALASGVPAELGLMTGIIGGIAVGMAAGQPLQVSGPAAGLAVIVFDIVQDYGVEALAPILLLAGAMQLAGCYFRLGRFFRGVSPAVISGMLAGIGVLIVAGQIHVLFADAPRAHGLDNLAAIPSAFFDISVMTIGQAEQALIVGIVTIASMVLWDRYKPARLKLMPGALLGVVAGCLVAAAGLDVATIDVPENIFSSFSLPTTADLSMLAMPGIIFTALAVAFIASAETLLSAAAVDKMQDRVRTRFDKELGGQGIGNFLCGLVGAMPMTGVIVRSSANVQAGAVSRLSAILHGVWILAFVAFLPGVLAVVPTAALAGVLVVVGWKLVKLGDAVDLFKKHGWLPAVIYVATLGTTVAVDLLVGVMVGLGLSLLEVIPHLRRQRSKVEARSSDGTHELHLDGRVSMLEVSRLTRALDDLPSEGPIRIRTEGLTFVDHTSVELISDAVTRKRRSGGIAEVTGGDSPASRALVAAVG